MKAFIAGDSSDITDNWSQHQDAEKSFGLQPITRSPKIRVEYRMARSGLAKMSDYGLLLKRYDVEISERARREQELRELSEQPLPQIVELQGYLQQSLASRDNEREELEQTYESRQQQLLESFQAELSQLRSSYDSVVQSLNSEAEHAIHQLVQQREESEWVVTSVLDDSAEDSPVRELEKYLAVVAKNEEEQQGTLSHLNEEAERLRQKYSWTKREKVPSSVALKSRDAATEWFREACDAAATQLKNIQSQALAKLFVGFRGLFLFVGLACLAVGLVYLFVDPVSLGFSAQKLQSSWFGISCAIGAFASLLLTLVLYTLSSMRQADLFHQLEQALTDAEAFHQQWGTLVEAEKKKQEKRTAAKQKRVEKERQEALDRYESALSLKREEILERRDHSLREELEKYESDRNQTILQREARLQALGLEYEKLKSESENRWSNGIQRLDEDLQQLQGQHSRSCSEKWMHLKSNWENACSDFFKTVDSVQQADTVTNRPWSELASGEWSPSQTMPAGIRFGTMNVDLNQWPDAVSADMRLAPRVSSFALPGEVAFPGALSTLFLSPTPESRTVAIQALQTMMLRLLLLIPPGKLRFTMIDPVSLGESFGGFMHLADYDELMVTNRVWTEAGQIEARLADLTAHMENIFQTYLRNEFQTIEEYNESAGEVAEPYHVLVISDFPAKFSEIAARRLVSIVNSGPRCGVYTLMNLDSTKPLPNNFELSDLLPHMSGYEWQESAFHAREQELQRWPISVETPPDSQEFTSIVKMVGEASKDARRVEVSFDRIAPQSSEVWSRDSRNELEIPLGRAGATKLQLMKLGKGTSQHMLVAGKTGSGKSTFLHILITNLALYYGPDEVNFFLIDFKKGVEFKEYATSRLPHAQVIAIESDREFGVSALQRLDELLQERGELFRKHGVQDIASFRNANPDVPLPRVLLIVDEFQEFFIEDDKLSQSAAQLLDRLVRQGRAFGVHVILGSQTLGGAYSLARTTLGQVAVRVALQCSEADAHLILSEENTAARLLTRPGEAIYNDANGMAEGNHPFQIGWLSDQERKERLQMLRQRLERSGKSSHPPIVFEGNIPSRLHENLALSQLVDEFSTRSTPIAAPTIWLGDAVEIQPPTAIQFFRQSGSHLLIVGQDADAATGIMMSAVMMLAASSAPSREDAQFLVFDGNPVGTSESTAWKHLVEALPVAARIVSPRETVAELEALQEELDARIAEEEGSRPPLFVFIHNIAKFRDLRKPEDDYGLGGFGTASESKPADPGKLFSTLLTDGPLNGIHFLIWCDSYNNVDRCFSRQMMKELEIRVALQMNAADSSNLIDTPAASRLGTHRALLYREETGLTEKFRPYGAPDASWIDEAARIMKNGPGSDFVTDLSEFSIL